MNATALIHDEIVDTGTVGVHYFPDMIQGSGHWLAARCGLITASEMKLVVAVEGGGTVTRYVANGSVPDKLTPKREAALQILQVDRRPGSMKDLAFLTNTSEGVLRELLKAGALDLVQEAIPRTYKPASDDKVRQHLYELMAQRITGYVEPHYVSDDMLRGHEDEVEARILYDKHFARVRDGGFITNNKFGFTIGYSPDGLIDDDPDGPGLLECKSRRQKFQAQMITEFTSVDSIPDEFMLQAQTGMMVSERNWVDFVSYCGGMPMTVVRIRPIPEIQEAILAACTAFEARLAEKLAVYHATVATKRTIPTERKEYEEITL